MNKKENVSAGMTGIFKSRIFDRVEFIEKHIDIFLEKYEFI